MLGGRCLAPPTRSYTMIALPDTGGEESPAGSRPRRWSAHLLANIGQKNAHCHVEGSLDLFELLQRAEVGRVRPTWIDLRPCGPGNLADINIAVRIHR